MLKIFVLFLIALKQSRYLIFCWGLIKHGNIRLMIIKKSIISLTWILSQKLTNFRLLRKFPLKNLKLKDWLWIDLVHKRLKINSITYKLKLRTLLKRHKQFKRFNFTQEINFLINSVIAQLPLGYLFTFELHL